MIFRRKFLPRLGLHRHDALMRCGVFSEPCERGEEIDAATGKRSEKAVS